MAVDVAVEKQSRSQTHPKSAGVWVRNSLKSAFAHALKARVF